MVLKARSQEFFHPSRRWFFRYVRKHFWIPLSLPCRMIIGRKIWYLLPYLIFILYGSLVDLQCYVSFRYTAKWFSYTYTYIHSFSDCFPIQIITEYWVVFPFYTVGPCWLIEETNPYNSSFLWKAGVYKMFSIKHQNHWSDIG